MVDKFELFSSGLHKSLYNKDGQVEDPEIAHEMAKVEDPYRKRDAFGLIDARQYRIKKGEKLAEAIGETLFQKKQHEENERRITENFQPKEPFTLDIGNKTDYDKPEPIAKHIVDLILQEWPENFPLDKEVELLELKGKVLPATIFEMSESSFPYQTFYEEIIDALKNSLKESGLSGKAIMSPQGQYTGEPNQKEILDAQKNKELYIRTFLYYDEGSKGVQPKIKIFATRLPSQTTALIKIR